MNRLNGSIVGTSLGETTHVVTPLSDGRIIGCAWTGQPKCDLISLSSFRRDADNLSSHHDGDLDSF